METAVTDAVQQADQRRREAPPLIGKNVGRQNGKLIGVPLQETDMTKWQRLGSTEESIASLMITGCDDITRAVCALFGSDVIPYSGIVISLNEDISDGGQMEKSCYSKGGFTFIFRSYAETALPGPNFPTTELVRTLELVATKYACDVLGLGDPRVYLDSCWAVCQRDGDYGALHNHTSPCKHKGRLFSGMLYLQAPPSISPKTFPNGCLHIITTKEVLYIPPIPGSICLWPAHLVHGIHPFRGTGDRLGVAFNVVII